ncbi:GtrA family protein [Halomicrobium sp. LC1Hm]|uniref:GtrA family protein n=1 Tax=Halomicrobium sp. LC1Hm TaxID=2610902 RepID=UPI001298420D|nr:GtrA family protein [Halomicrobium sp. LC1Hm]QGA81734.1 GtrA-like flippase [Halomicrobium sp. LC1Hm]
MVRNLLRNLHSGPLALQLRRFVVVGGIAFALQQALLALFVEGGRLNDLVALTIAIEITIVFQYVLNNAWTFEATQNTGRREFLVGLLKTNLVRGSAIPIQLGIFHALSEWASMYYLLANVFAVLVSGVYRYVLDARWTWGQA